MPAIPRTVETTAGAIVRAAHRWASIHTLGRLGSVTVTRRGSHGRAAKRPVIAASRPVTKTPLQVPQSVARAGQTKCANCEELTLISGRLDQPGPASSGELATQRSCSSGGLGSARGLGAHAVPMGQPMRHRRNGRNHGPRRREHERRAQVETLRKRTRTAHGSVLRFLKPTGSTAPTPPCAACIRSAGRGRS